MTEWPSVRARQVLAVLRRTGWCIAAQRGSHRVLVKEGQPISSLHFMTVQRLGYAASKRRNKAITPAAALAPKMPSIVMQK